MKKFFYSLLFLATLSLVFPSTLFAFGGSASQGSSSNRRAGFKKKEQRLLAKLGHAKLIRALRKAKRGRHIRAILKKGRAIIAAHNKKSRAARAVVLKGLQKAAKKKAAQRIVKRKIALQKRAKARKAALQKRAKARKAALQKRAKVLKAAKLKRKIALQKRVKVQKAAKQKRAKAQKAAKLKRKAALQKRAKNLKIALKKRLAVLLKARKTVKRRKSLGRIIRAIRVIRARLAKMK